jgi:hypothetical protein
MSLMGKVTVIDERAYQKQEWLVRKSLLEVEKAIKDVEKEKEGLERQRKSQSVVAASLRRVTLASFNPHLYNALLQELNEIALQTEIIEKQLAQRTNALNDAKKSWITSLYKLNAIEKIRSEYLGVHNLAQSNKSANEQDGDWLARKATLWMR